MQAAFFANELTSWNGINVSYDANGNMLTDGSNIFTWNARNQVASLNNVSLQYDAFGRRAKNLAGTSFLYDGANAVQELSGTTVTANLLSGGIDEIFTRADSSGALTPLKDALGSTIALVDSTGNVQTSYTYDPFGKTSVTGTTNGNELQYTGRENDGNGLYYYHNRYYSPLLARFVSEDALGFGGGDVNFYAYVFDSPLNWTDPTGLDVCITFWPQDAHGYGHIGIGVNTCDTSGFYSTKQPLCLVLGCDDPGQVIPDRQHHPGVAPKTLILRATTGTRSGGSGDHQPTQKQSGELHPLWPQLRKIRRGCFATSRHSGCS